MKRVLGRPGTVIVRQVDGTERYQISGQVELSDHEIADEVVIGMTSESGMVNVDLASYEQEGGSVRGRTPGGARVTARSYVPEDAVMTVGLPGYSIPVPVMAALLSGENGTMRLEALCEADGYVSTVMMVTDVGMWLRYAGAWWDLPSVDVIDGLYTVDIPEGALDLYDTADQGGRQLHISSFPQDEGTPAKVSEDIYVQSGLMAPVTAALIIEEQVELPVIDTVRELMIAIPDGEAHPEIRWYIEKRRQALGPGVELPWE